jgi:hypothetical protein
MRRDTEFHRELRALFAEDDRARAEHAAFMEARRASASSPASETGDEGVITQDDGGDVPLAAPAADGEAFCFTDEQFDAVAAVLAELHREFEARIERTERRLLDAMLRLALPGERAEEIAYALKERIARMEGTIERQLSSIVERHLKQAKTDDDDGVIDLPAGFIGRRHDA